MQLDLKYCLLGNTENELGWSFCYNQRQLRNSRKSYVSPHFKSIYRLPNGGNRSPDVAWVSLERWKALKSEEQEKFPPICPDFVLELRSRTDALSSLRAKMQKYLNSGLRLGWLVNPQEQQVEIYRPKKPVEIINLPALFNGEEILLEFTLFLTRF